MLASHRHNVEAAVVGRQDDLEFIAGSRQRPHRLLDLHRKHLDAAQIDQVISAPGERTDGSHVGAAAWAGAVSKVV